MFAWIKTFSSYVPPWLWELLPILLLLLVIALVVSRLPKSGIEHSPAFRKRRFFNWFFVGMTYAFLYMGRYNLNSTIGPIFDKEQFSGIYAIGTITYGISFIINGPLTDRFGGRKTILVSALGVLIANFAMGWLIPVVPEGVTLSKEAALFPKEVGEGLYWPMAGLYALNMYFQSFGAVSIVKVNGPWFHLRERGTFGGIFGILISLGIYFAFDWPPLLLKAFGPAWVFYAPALILGAFFVLNYFIVRDNPSDAGYPEIEAHVPEHEAAAKNEEPTVFEVARRMLTNPIILTISFIEFCSGFLRNAILQYYRPFIKDIGLTASDFVYMNWGMMNCIAGILGGMFAGVISDKLFQSRRGPVSSVLYGIMIAGSLVMFATLSSSAIGWVVLMMMLSVIGVHGMLSGTASVDFGGRKSTGLAVGIIDGFVYLGIGLNSALYASVLPKKPEATDASNWWIWPATMLPFALVGFFLALRVWNAKPTSKSAAH